MIANAQISQSPPKMLDQVRERIRLKDYSIRTEKPYLVWIRRFIFFHDKRYPKDTGKPEVEVFLTHLAMDRHVVASAQNQTPNRMLLPDKEVLGTEFPWTETCAHQ